MTQRTRFSVGSFLVVFSAVVALALAVFFALRVFFPELYPFDIPNT
jgi:hypothetical protein